MTNKSTRTLSVLIMAAVLTAMIFAVSPALAQGEGRIQGLVYNDKNNNGVQDTGELGVADVEVVFETGDWRLLITTGLDGTYGMFLNPATWTVSINPPEGWTAAVTSQDVLISTPGEEKNGVNFAIVEADDVLPESGGPISESTLFILLITLAVIGVALIVYGQTRKQQLAS